MLAIHNKARASPQLLSASLQVLLREHQGLVGAHEHDNEHQRTEDDEPVFEDGGEIRREGGGQVDPSMNVGWQIPYTL